MTPGTPAEDGGLGRPKVVSEKRECGSGELQPRTAGESWGADCSPRQGLGGSRLWGQRCAGPLGRQPAHGDICPVGISTVWVKSPDSKVAEGLTADGEEG